MRPNRHQMYMAMARAAASRATCYRLNVGAVIVEDKNVIAIGYNGAPSGEDHCTGNGCRYFQPTGCQVIHAERNAIERALRMNHAPGPFAELYCTHSPCDACVTLILEECRHERSPLIIMEVFFEVAYRDSTPLKRLLDADIDVHQVMPSGLLIDHRTGNLCEPS